MRQSWVGPEHFLLAVLAEPGVVREVLAGLGLTHDRLATALAGMKIANGKRLRYFASKGATTNPAAHQVIGWAQGFAAASGRMKPKPEDWFLAIAYGDCGVAESIVHTLGLSTAALVQAVGAAGVRVPDYLPTETRPWRGHREVEIDRAEWQAVSALLSKQHPPGSDWRWGFNSRRDRPGKVQFLAEDGIDLESIVSEARRSDQS